MAASENDINDNILAPQLRAARALLAWSQERLAEGSGIPKGTIARIELGGVAPQRRTLNAIRTALEAAGVEFTNGDAPGVKLRPRPWQVEVYAAGQEAGLINHQAFENFSEAFAWFEEQKRIGARPRILGPRSASDEELQAIIDAGGEPTFR